jgi:hypothetical protein
LPSKFRGDAAIPQEIPTRNEKLLGTSCGYLLNELTRSPESIIASTLTLTQLMLAMNTGDVFSSSKDVVLFILRIVCRIENAMAFVYTRMDTLPDANMLEPSEQDSIKLIIGNGLKQLHTLFRGRATSFSTDAGGTNAEGPDGAARARAGEPQLPSAWSMLVEWRANVADKIGSLTRGTSGVDSAEMDALVRSQCDLHAHGILLVRNCGQSHQFF